MRIIYIILLGLFIPLSHISKADHIIGSDLSYRCSGTNDSIWKVTFNFYRDCNGCYVLSQSPKCGTNENCNSSQTAPTAVAIRCMDNNSSVGTLNLVRTSITDITKTCKAVKSKCAQPCNTSYPYGIEKHTFEGTLDLRAAMRNGCCRFELSALLYVRNVAITTGQQQQSFFTFAELNACAKPCNSSPALTNDPVAILCCNQPYVFNNGAVDTANYDSLSYSFSGAYQNRNQLNTYNGGRSPSNPIQAYYPNPLKHPYTNPDANPPIGLYLDAESGDIIFTPTDCSQVAVVVMQIDEWRKDSTGKYKNIGITRRDMQFIVTQCPDNNPPRITNTKFLFNTCEGSQICFNITTDDKVFTPPPPAPTPTPDTVTLTWNRGIPGATFKVLNPNDRLKTGEFCWTPPVGTSSSLPYSFTATVTDDACPKNASSTRSFRILVKPKAQDTRKYADLGCGFYSAKATPANNFAGTPSYDWQIRDSTGILIFDKKTAYFKSTGTFISTKDSDVVHFRKGGKYILQHIVNNKPNDCPTTYYDTLIIPDLLEVNLALGKDTFVCIGATLRFSPYLKNEKAPVSYKWATPNVHNSKDTLSYFDISPTSDTSVSLFVQDGSKCTAWDTVKIFLRENPKVNIGPDLRICSYDSALFVPVIDTVKTKINDSTWANQGNTFRYTWYLNKVPYSSDSILGINQKGTYELHVTDSLGCIGKDTAILYVNDVVTAYAGVDQVKCWNDSLILVAQGLDTVGNGKSGTYRWWDITSNVPIRINKGTAKTLKFPITVTTNFQLELYVTEDTTTCYHTDTVNVKVNALPAITKPTDQSVCCDAGDIGLNLLSPTPAPAGGKWYSNQRSDIVVFDKTFLTGKVCDPTNKTTWSLVYEFTDPATTCVNRDSMKIVVNPLPRVTLKEGYYCQDLQKTKLIKHVLQPGNPNLGTQEWKCVDCRGYKESDLIKNVGSPLFPDYELNFDETTMNLGSKNEDTLFLEFSFRDGSGCRNKDTAFFRIVRVPKISWIGFKPLCWSDGLVSLNTLSKVDPKDGIWISMDTLGYTKMPAGSILGDTLDTRKTDPLGKTYYMRYLHTASGCPVWKDTTLTINPLPKVTPTPVPALVCENQAPITLSATPSGGTWSSPQTGVVSAGRFSPATSPAGVSLKMIYRYTNPVTGCSGSDSITSMVEALAELEILTADLDTCRSPLISKVVSARFSNTPSITWMPLSGGTVDNAKGNPVTFTFSTTHDTIQQLLLYVMTEDGNACPFVDDLMTIRVHPIPHVTVTPDDPNGCNPHAVTFNTVFNNKVNPTTATYAWDFGDGATGLVQNPVHSYTKEGVSNVSLKVTSDRGCDSSVGLQVEVYPNPQADFTPNPNNYTTAALPRFKFMNQSAVSNVLGSYLEKHEWDFGDPNSNTDTSTEHSPMFYYPGDTANYQVWLKVTTNYGCTDSTMRLVRIGPDILVFIPNAFTPGKGGPSKNENFNVVASGFKTYNMMIFNRWGEIIFESNDINKGWDGTFNGADCQQDVYAYSLKVTSLNDESYEYSGVIHLLR